MTERGESDSTEGISDAVHAVAVFILSFIPAGAAHQFPGEVLENKHETFITVYFLTLPWSLAVSVIVAGLIGGWFGDDVRVQAVVVVAILFGSALFGGAIAPETPSEFRGGPLPVILLQLAVFALFGYMLMYGVPLFLASGIVAAYVGWWAHQKVFSK